VTAAIATAARPFGAWRVVWAAFVVAVFGWGWASNGPPVFLFAVHEARGWSVPLVSAAVPATSSSARSSWRTSRRYHRRIGVAGATRLGGVLSALGVVGWALAGAPGSSSSPPPSAARAGR
jgi:hypothetical protein